MGYNKVLKIRLSGDELEKVRVDSLAIDKTVSEHVRDMIVDFEVIDYKRDLEMGFKCAKK